MSQISDAPSIQNIDVESPQLSQRTGCLCIDVKFLGITEDGGRSICTVYHILQNVFSCIIISRVTAFSP